MLIPLALAVGFSGGLFTAYIAQYRSPCGNNTIGHRLAHISGTHMQSICAMEIGKWAAEGFAEGLRKGSGNMLTEMPKVGDKVRYVGRPGDFNSDVTYGKIYSICNAGSDEVSFVDDEGNVNNRSHISRHSFDKFELVEEPTIPCGNCGSALGEVAVGGHDGGTYCSNECAEPSPSVTDLIANLAHRVGELEESLQWFAQRDRKTTAKVAELDAKSLTQVDAVNSPQHYKRGKFETIEVIEHIMQGYDDPFVSYCVGNTAKYIDRAPFKHGSPAEDLRKAAWYLTRAADHIDGVTHD